MVKIGMCRRVVSASCCLRVVLTAKCLYTQQNKVFLHPYHNTLHMWNFICTIFQKVTYPLCPHQCKYYQYFVLCTINPFVPKNSVWTGTNLDGSKPLRERSILQVMWATTKKEISMSHSSWGHHNDHQLFQHFGKFSK